MKISEMLKYEKVCLKISDIWNYGCLWLESPGYCLHIHKLMPSVFSLNITQCDLKFLFIFVFVWNLHWIWSRVLQYWQCNIDSSYRFNNGLYRTHDKLGNFGYLLYLSNLEDIWDTLLESINIGWISLFES